MSLISVCYDNKEPLVLHSCCSRSGFCNGKENYVLLNKEKWKDLVCVKIDRTLFIRKVEWMVADFSDFYITRLKRGDWDDYAVQTDIIRCSRVAYLTPFESYHLLPELDAIVSSYARPYKVFDPKQEWKDYLVH